MKKLMCIIGLMLLCVLSPAAYAADAPTYVLMNIPYADFYSSEGAANVNLDAVTSATLNKPRTMGLAGGS